MAITRIPVAIIRLVLCAGLAGCAASPEPRLYVLVPVPPTAPRVELRSAPVVMEAFRLPQIYDRPEMERRGADGRILVNDQDRWAAPLEDMCTEVLAADLADRLPPGRVLGPGEPRPPGPSWRVFADGHIFDMSADGHVTLDAVWSAVIPQQPLLRAEEHVEIDAAGRTQAIAMSAALAELADRIAERLARSTKDLG